MTQNDNSGGNVLPPAITLTIEAATGTAGDLRAMVVRQTASLIRLLSDAPSLESVERSHHVFNLLREAERLEALAGLVRRHALTLGSPELAEAYLGVESLPRLSNED